MKRFIYVFPALIFMSLILFSCKSGSDTSSGADYSVAIVPEKGTLRLSELYDNYEMVNLTGVLVSGFVM